MFLDFYGLNAQPFGVTPDPGYLYFSPGHREALASLFYGIETRRGFLALIAAPGMGKTTLLFQLLERLKGSARTVFLFQTQCDSREILHFISDGLGVRRDNDSVRMHARLNNFLLREAQAGRRVVLFIDEAQNLSDSVLETVRLLSDFEATDRKLLQIVLAGQPELARRLLLPGLVQLRQRIAVLTHLRPLPAEEIPRYINHRLQVAGYLGPELFTPEALSLIAKGSEGVPRNINNICFSTLSLGFATSRKKIDGHTVREAMSDLSLDSYAEQTTASARVPTRPERLRFPSAGNRLLFRFALLTALLLVALVSGLAYLPAFGFLPGRSAPDALEVSGSQSERSWPSLANADSNTPGSQRFPAGGGSGEQAQPPKIHEQATITEITPRADSHALSAGSSVIQRDADSSALQTGDRNKLLVTYVVQPEDTLSDLCVRFLGRYDPAVLTEIQELNRSLLDPNRLEVGQWLTLPSRPSKGSAPPNSPDVPIRHRSN